MSDFNTDYNRLGEIHSYGTRNVTDFVLQPHQLTMTTKKPSYAGAKFYNLLPRHLKSITRESALKRNLSAWLADRTFYSIEEFLNWT
ncbi:hypothetical protein J6590_056469 [Homalodisca vitripennis]|nr:hypothetical protein J6590_056469 [Homalodisca vitripennis]